MLTENNNTQKTSLHPRNKNKERYNLQALILAKPDLAKYLKPNKFAQDTIDFTNPIAVKLLNQALLHHYYGIKNWNFPAQNLCPPIPGRADYIHHIADLLGTNYLGKIPTGNKITCLDIGVGASCIYPIIAVTEYNWQCIATDIDPKSIEIAQNIVQQNEALQGKIECVLQKNEQAIFNGIIQPNQKIDISICNPPFHASAQEAQKGTQRKIKNLSGKKTNKTILNFAGITNELICEGGEYQFIQNMITESEMFAKNCYWFSTLVSKNDHLKGIYQALKIKKISQLKTIPINTGNKTSRIVAWTFLSEKQQTEWRKNRW